PRLSAKAKAAKRSKLMSHRNRQAQRQKSTDSKPKARYFEKHVKHAPTVHTAHDAKKIKIASTGYIGVRGKNSAQTFRLDELVGENSRFKFDLVEWDGITPTPIVDKNSLVVGALAGKPGSDPTWPDVQLGASGHLDTARSRLVFDKKDKKHRRGNFPA
ncbi:hypothetical protein GALMADRAFT_43520, partial [Galerina marginata CBS 339.88]